MKGQFMLITSIFAGMIIISAASTITEVQSRSVVIDQVSNKVEIIKYEAEKVYDGRNYISETERENFEEMVSLLSEYRTEVEYWDRGTYSCFNVTVRAPGEERFLKCIN